MIGAWLMPLCLTAGLFLITGSWLAYAWHRRSVGEREAHAEYARMRREQPDIAEARLPASCALMAGRPWH